MWELQKKFLLGMDIMKDNRRRLLEIYTQLLEGKKIKISELVEQKYGTEDTIRKDKDSIRDFLLEKDHERSLFGELVYSHGVGFYLDKSYTLTDDERLAIIKVLLSSRSLHKNELFPIIDKLTKQANDDKRIERITSSERFNYVGVPQCEDMLERMNLIQYAIDKQLPLSFTYQKNFETFEFTRIPLGIVFIDLYYFMITASHKSEDYLDFEKSSKFRINNIQNLRLDEQATLSRLQYADFPKLGELINETGRWAFLGKPVDIEVECLFDPAYILDRFPKAKLLSMDEEKKSARILIPANSGYGIKMWLLSQSASMRIIKPNYLRESMVEILNEMANLYGYELTKIKE